MKLGTFLCAVVLSALATVPAAEAETIEDFLGVYVGVATELDSTGARTGERHIDFIVTPARRRGFSIEVISVRLVDGRRDVPGVRRRVRELTFLPHDDEGIYVARGDFSPFEEQEGPDVLAGDPIIWAYIEGPSMFITSLALRADGRYDLEVFERRIVPGGLEVNYERSLDGRTGRRVIGTLIRVE